MASHFLSSFGIIASESLKDLVMVQSSTFFSDLDVGYLSPGLDDLIIVFVVADWY
jgi:hypothetical protein